MLLGRIAKVLMVSAMIAFALIAQPTNVNHFTPAAVQAAAPATANVQSFESAQIVIRRLRDGRVISNPNSTYPNDRVARGEGYAVEITYRTDVIRPPASYDVKVITRVNNAVKKTRFFKATGLETFYYWKDTVSTSTSFRDVYFEAYSRTGVLLASQRLPIGSY
ncbi:MAG TPA: hypothetical protein PLD20_21260 [Blastocatellia bacterium]|nr:hypothetical protein [Blastocatellia bacterium]HMV82404.1 hypothetical protein [Blastocatellia bacterium]HMX29353.1 hypothetical protein [Blastocatellia bacterium]HMY74256.1 hypothetical protein [Blastocatellia bacterium]HMZ20480.1 hypothetical protein [Blastocatellia bacterium]